jgi:hypothetical protein
MPPRNYSCIVEHVHTAERGINAASLFPTRRLRASTRRFWFKPASTSAKGLGQQRDDRQRLPDLMLSTGVAARAPHDDALAHAVCGNVLVLVGAIVNELEDDAGALGDHDRDTSSSVPVARQHLRVHARARHTSVTADSSDILPSWRLLRSRISTLSR